MYDTYSKLDYILLEHRLLETVHLIHDPVIVKLRLKETQNRTNTWRLNEDLIQHKEIGDKIKNEREQYFLQNEFPDVSKTTIWEAHKAYIRNVSISIGVRRGKGNRNGKGNKRNT